MSLNQWIPYRHNKNLVKKLLETLPYSTRYLRVNGAMRPPIFDNRNLKGLERAAKFHGLEFPKIEKFVPPKPEAQWYSKHGFIKPFKGRKADRVHDKRIQLVNDSLKGMYAKKEKLHEEMRQLRYKDPLDLGLFGKVTIGDNSGGNKLVYGAGKKKKDNSKNAKKKK
jgi:hypothetical protein